MRKSISLFLLLVSPGLALAADLTLRVSDPSGSLVAGATVTLYQTGNSAVVASSTTAATGNALFRGLAPGAYNAEILAPGFARSLTQIDLRDDSVADVHLKVAARPETVVVTATETPFPADDTAAPVETLDRDTLENRQPVEVADAIRFLPGAIINTSGRRGGLASLFVRGGDSRYNKVIVDGVPVNEPGGRSTSA